VGVGVFVAQYSLGLFERFPLNQNSETAGVEGEGKGKNVRAREVREREGRAFPPPLPPKTPAHL